MLVCDHGRLISQLKRCILNPSKGLQNGSTKLCCAQHVLLLKMVWQDLVKYFGILSAFIPKMAKTPGSFDALMTYFRMDMVIQNHVQENNVPINVIVHSPHKIISKTLKYTERHAYCLLHFDNDGVMQERCNSIANALESRLSCTDPSICLDTITYPFLNFNGDLAGPPSKLGPGCNYLSIYLR